MANKTAAQNSRCVKCFMKVFRAPGRGRVQGGAGLKARALKIRKKYPLIISDERVSPRQLNLMTLGRMGPLCCLVKPVGVEETSSVFTGCNR